MILPLDALLIVGIIGFYVWDSLIFLYRNNVVYVEKYGEWDFFIPQSGWTIMGKNIYLPNPFAPDYGLFLASWSLNKLPINAPEITFINDRIGIMGFLRAWAMVIFTLLLIVFPTSFLFLHSELILLISLCLVYLAIIVSLVVVYKKRNAFLLSKKEFWILAFELLVCPPFSINLVRKLTLRLNITSDAVYVGKQLLSKERLAAMIEKLDRQIVEQATSVDDDHDRRTKIDTYRNHMKELTNDVD